MREALVVVADAHLDRDDDETASFCEFLNERASDAATLGLLGLGVAEPLPSLGGVLSELQNLPAVAESPWMTAPAVLLVSVLICLRVAIPRTEDS